ncbi:MAG: hypothetical protein PHX43_02545 [Alphaproteobacteria bacterium]|nr:hypothetical protein [Alphaproteobacteria bacterium]
MSRRAAVVLFLSGLVFFAYLTLSPIEVMAAHGGGEKAEGGGKAEGDKKKKDEGISGGRFAGDPMYVHIPPFILPVVTDKGAEQIVTLMVDLKVKDGWSAEKIHDNMPRIKDAMMQALYGGLGDGALRNGVLVDVSRIREKIFEAVTGVMGPGLIEEVLIQAIAQRRL